MGSRYFCYMLDYQILPYMHDCLYDLSVLLLLFVSFYFYVLVETFNYYQSQYSFPKSLILLDQLVVCSY